MFSSSFPVDPATLGAYALTVLVVVMSPGPDTVLIVRYSLTSGRRVGLFTVAGVQLGLLVHTLLAALGIGLIIASSPTLFNMVAIAGAAYLGWLGLQGFHSGGGLRFNADRPPVGTTKAVRDAMLCNLLNPKVIVLFLALLPNFVHTERGNVPLQLVVLSSILIVINVVWQAPIALAAERVRRWLKNPVIERRVSYGTGAILLLFAVLMLVDNLKLGG